MTLYQLELQWGELLSKNREIELACQALEAELGPLPHAAADQDHDFDEDQEGATAGVQGNAAGGTSMDQSA